MRIFAFSDIHADYDENMAWVDNLSLADYRRDAVIVAGDISHSPDLFDRVMAGLLDRFAHVFFVPGNHDLWVRSGSAVDSLARYYDIMARCASLCVHTGPARLGGNGSAVWIVPFASWYVKPEEGEGSLFVVKQNEDPRQRMWVDDTEIRWPEFPGSVTAARFFLGQNEEHITARYDAPVISFSHFLPRRELIFSTPEELTATGIPAADPHPRFNFSRVAGCTCLDEQIRRLGSAIHVYGHQHRNRDREIDGVRYMSYCLGYPRERADSRIACLTGEPLLVWGRG